MRTVKIGTELEYEVSGDRWDAMDDLKKRGIKIIGTVKCDLSLQNGLEVNTTYTTISNWKRKDIKVMTDALKKYKANNDMHTAGQHIHLSGYSQMPIYKKMIENFNYIRDFLYPINARYREIVYPNGYKVHAHYGLGNDMFRFNDEYGTIEIRAFASTIKPSVIRNRMIVVREMYRYLASDKPISELFNCLSKAGRRAYKMLLFDKDNPHEFGAQVEEVLQKL